MLTNAKHYIIIIAVSLLIGFGVSYAWNNKTLSEMVEEYNQQILSDCLTKARIQKTTKDILEYASNCNKDILTNLSTPRSVETITWTHSTGNTVPPLWFQLIPTAEAKSVESASKELQIKNTKVSTTHSTIWDTNTWNVRTPKQIYEQVNCNTECKIETITKLGINSNLANLIVTECKEWAIDPIHCIIVASSIVINESGGGKSNACKTRFNCMWIWSWKVSYTSYQEAVANWVSKYNRYWFKAKDMNFFYATTWNIPPSRYCMSEWSSWSDLWCPNWLRITTSIFKKLNQLF